MKRIVLAALAAALALGSACGRLNSPEKKAGYAVGLSIGQSLQSIATRIETDQVGVGLKDQLAGKASMDEQRMQELLMSLSTGQAGDKGQLGYAVGMSIGRNIENIRALIDTDRLQAGIKDRLAGSPKMTDEQVREALNELTTRQQGAQAAERQKKSAQNKVEGQAYLESNKAKPGVKVTASGLQYEVVKQGKGARPKATNTVRVHYVGTLIDGTEFDSSRKRGQPAEFPLGGVIAGWTEGLQLMPVGSIYRFTIPSELAYGSGGAGAQIGPDAVLNFEVELLAIVR